MNGLETKPYHNNRLKAVILYIKYEIGDLGELSIVLFSISIERVAVA